MDINSSTLTEESNIGTGLIKQPEGGRRGVGGGGGGQVGGRQPAGNKITMIMHMDDELICHDTTRNTKDTIVYTIKRT